MRLISIFLIALLIPSLSFAAAKDARISDLDGDVLSINSNGTANASTTSTRGSGTAFGALDRRICDSQGDCLTVNSNGSFNATVGVPNN